MPARSAPNTLLLGWRKPQRSCPFGFAPALPGPEADERPEPIHADDEGHLLTIGPTGSGKGVAAIITALLAFRGLTLVIDPKGEACHVTARQRALLGPVLRLDPYGKTTNRPDALNPFDLVRHTSMGIPEAALLLTDLLAPPTFTKDPFWDNRATSLIAGLVAYILACEPPERCHPGTLRDLLTGNDPVYQIAVLLDTKKKEMGTFAYQELAQFLNLAERETRPSVLATATQHLTLFGDDSVAEAVCTTTVDLDAVRRGTPMTIYLVLPVDKLRSHGRLLRLWVATLLRVLMARTRRPETPTLFLLDEAAQIGRLGDLVTAMTLLRGYGVRVWSFWQDLQQLKRLYPNEWQTLLTNARTLQIFGAHWLFRKELAGLLGVHPDALTVPKGEQLLVAPDGAITRAQKANYLTDEPFQGRFDENPLFKEWKRADPDRAGRSQRS